MTKVKELQALEFVGQEGVDLSTAPDVVLKGQVTAWAELWLHDQTTQGGERCH